MRPGSLRRPDRPAAGRRRALAVAALALACTIPPSREPTWVTIPPGASVAAVAESLAANHIVRSARRFRRLVEMLGVEAQLQPGTYPLRPGTPMHQVVPVLLEGRPLATAVTVPPGITLTELAQALAQRLGLRADSVLVAARHPALRARLETAAPTLEGYLFPTTYRVPQGADAAAVVRQMADTFEARWRAAWNRRLDTLRLTRHQLVTLASIVEGERPYDDAERGRIASVYHNRLARGMRLQADPTVVYALGERRRLSHRDYAVQSAHNTYRIDGLPPWPINQPSEASLRAALYPPETEYLYFVARRDGRHVFSRTYREHLAATRRAQRGLLGIPEPPAEASGN